MTKGGGIQTPPGPTSRINEGLKYPYQKNAVKFETKSSVKRSVLFERAQRSEFTDLSWMSENLGILFACGP